MNLSAELYLLLAVMSSASMAVILKIFQSGRGNRYAIILGNYLTCVLIAFLMLPDKGIVLRTAPATLLCGSIGGILFVAGLVGTQSSIRVNGAILTSAFSRLGLLVPLSVSILCFKERPGILQMAGILLVLAAIWLISGSKESGMKLRISLLAAVLLFCGGADAMAKIFEHVGQADQDLLYFLYIFSVAAILTAVLLVLEYRSSGKKPAAEDFLAGIAVGIPNYFSSMLLLKALESLPAFIVYPSFSTGAIILVTLVSVLFFRERPGKRQWVGLGLILAALVILNI